MSNPAVEWAEKMARVLNEKIQRAKETFASPGETVPRVAKGAPVPAADAGIGVVPASAEAATAAASAEAAPASATAAPDPAKLSGKKWWDANEGNAPYKESDQLSDLEADFQTKVKEFKSALEAAGASISIDTTKRSKERAHIFHYAWKIANDKIKPNAVPAMAGVDIVWDHGDDKKSKAGAQEILTAASVAATEPSLTSNHIDGTAIDWTITWTAELKIKQKDGTEVSIKGPDNGGDHNKELHAVGKTYGVIKGIFKKADNPHWSADGS
jgi:hypothetical protein